MSRRMKVFMALLAAVLLLTIGGAAVLASPPTDKPAPPANGSKNILARVAQILGITTDNLTAAFKQSRRELLPQPPKPRTDNITRPGAVKPQLRNKPAATDNRTKQQAIKQQLRNKAKQEVKQAVKGKAQARVASAPGQQMLQDRHQKILARVAELLGIPLERLQQAFQQAREEMREQAIQDRLNKAVEKNIISQPEAQQIRDWWQSRPKAALAKLFPKGFWWKR